MTLKSAAFPLLPFPMVLENEKGKRYFGLGLVV